ncbi:hypothetical protein SLEP1_g54986 [Rubroshorea leprosula]|uniref:Sucrose-phosphatase C-terminal domain-containing protein n=1 Tax=Rubroshorea leprosula TaxID=152421 RepID=A0AAV5ME35_9ROSI|nr:hypothetical protein SLEP1_g54986 [Rubroshorea leprosula]
MDRLSASACHMIVSDLDHTMDPSAVTVHPSGVEEILHERIQELKEGYGDKQGKRFQVWVDHVLSTQIGSSTWLVNFNKWEQCGDVRCCCPASGKISANVRKLENYLK